MDRHALGRMSGRVGSLRKPLFALLLRGGPLHPVPPLPLRIEGTVQYLFPLCSITDAPIATEVDGDGVLCLSSGLD
jgi:hypothetical protein